MNWSNVRLILMREVRDQLRDRRTLFMIAVLPLLLYPLLGMSFFQVTQFMREHPIRVLVVGAPQVAELPPLVEDDHFAAKLTAEVRGGGRIHVTAVPSVNPEQAAATTPVEQARRDMDEGGYDVVVYFPPNFAQEFERFHQRLLRAESEPADEDPEVKIPDVDISRNMAKDASKAAYHRVSDILDRWREDIGQQNLKETHIPALAARPFEIATRDVAEQGQVRAAIWSKILPLVLLIWALTGAFYPAVDLCAGEKERGTLETLLSSPAERIDIVWGKLLTVMLFSMATALLNLGSLAFTGSFILSQVPELGPPPGLAIVWLLLALVPMSALFSALCLALAAFARSTKEGQYYLMPLILIVLPLTMVPMAPGAELNLGNSLIPVTGVVLLLRWMLEGNYLAALPYVPGVVAVTLACCWLAIRWATNQFNSESVLFRESERWGLGVWLKHLRRDREDTPSFAEALFCGVLILVVKFFLGFALTGRTQDFFTLAIATQLVVVLIPALSMTAILTRSPAKTLLLRRPPLFAASAAVLLAVALHPLVNGLQVVVRFLYPLNPEVEEVLLRMESGLGEQWWLMLLVIGLLPALCEELAFRGFILSGCRRLGHKGTAIVVSSLFFAATHSIFQQQVISFLVGLIIAYVAIQTGSLLPGVLFHLVHNSLALLVKLFILPLVEDQAWLGWLINAPDSDGPLYTWPVLVVSLIVSVALLAWFRRLPYARTAEESLQESIRHQSVHWQPS